MMELIGLFSLTGSDKLFLHGFYFYFAGFDVLEAAVFFHQIIKTILRVPGPISGVSVATLSTVSLIQPDKR
jgi:hypothetical protein